MDIRRANIKDAQMIAHIASVLGYQQDTGDNLAIQRLQHLLSSQYDCIWVAERDGNVIGWLHAQHAFRAASKDFIEILGLSVDPEVRLQGAGRALVEQAKEWALEKNIALRVRTNETRDVAKKFYVALEFSLTKTQCVFQRES